MSEYLAPGVYIEEVPFKSHPIEGVPTSTAAFLDIFEQGPINNAVKTESFADFERVFGGLHPRSEASYAIRQYYLNGGRVAWVVRVDDPSPGNSQEIPRPKPACTRLKELRRTSSTFCAFQRPPTWTRMVSLPLSLPPPGSVSGN